MMRIMLTAPALLLAAVCLSGCKNTLFFAADTKTAIDLSIGEDPSEPIALDIGYRDKALVFTPPKVPDKDANGVPKGDALSMFSHFAVGVRRTESGSRVAYVENAFASGRAARLLADKPEAANAFVQQNVSFTQLRTPTQDAEFNKAADCVEKLSAQDKVRFARANSFLELPQNTDVGETLTRLSKKSEGDLKNFNNANCK